MPKGLIRDYSRRTRASDRESFTTPLFETADGNVELDVLRWGDEVELDEREPGIPSPRQRVVKAGTTGFVQSEHVVLLAYVDRRREGGAWRYTAPLYEKETGSAKKFDVLWGDRLQILAMGTSRSRVRVRGYEGWLSSDAITAQGLLELYFIDVGQGDGVLIRTPDDRHLLIDGGYPRTRQPTNKSAADFVDWKFFDDYGDYRVRLDAMIASHCDLDHYGGLDDLLGASDAAREELDTAGADIEAFYHAGVSWWEPSRHEIEQYNLRGDARDRWLGPTADDRLTRLLGDHDSLRAALSGGDEPQLQGMWKRFLQKIDAATTQIVRLGIDADDVGETQYLPGFDPTAGWCTIRVLAPVTHRRHGEPAVVDFGDDSQNTNGHSLVLRLDYAHARILLTGDLNKLSMQAIRKAFGEHMREFACDVAKACHHGSEDVSYAFLLDMRPAATVISSGDVEGHAHPRAAIVAASGLTGHVEIDATTDELITPLVYSTEIERSIRLGRTERIETSGLPHGADSIDFNLFARDADNFQGALKAEAQAHEEAKVTSTLHYRESRPAFFTAKRATRRLKGAYLATGVRYGLVNVRTDGNQIICATQREDGEGWTVRSFKARF